MAKSKYTGNIVTKTREYTQKELEFIEKFKRDHPFQSTVTMERLLWMDSDMVPGASMYMECIWLWDGVTRSGVMEEPHVHDFDEVIGFIGSDPDNPKELGATMEMHLGDEVHYLKKSCLMHIPAGMKHCPLTFKEVNRPVFFFTLAPISSYGRTSGYKDPEAMKKTAFVPPAEPDKSGSRYGRYIITEPKSHIPKNGETPRRPPGDAKTTHMVSLDSEVSSGAFYVDFVWIWKGNISWPMTHRHDFDEMVGFASAGTKDNPREIDGDVSIDLGGEKHQLTKSSLVYVHKGLDHCPIEFKNIKKPVLFFTIGNTTKWDKVEEK